MAIDPDIEWYYNKGGEASRLNQRYKLEAIRTRRLIEKHLSDAAHEIVDIGGAAGAYAFWLSEQGYSVHLVDPIPLHIRQAEDASRDLGVTLAGLHIASAEELPFEDAAFDTALFMGPLYHLIERHTRIKALRECRRILRPGGQIFAVAISRYGTVVEGLFKDYISLPRYADLMLEAARTGIHRNPDRQSGFFTTAYFHTPAELAQELIEAGFGNLKMRAIEGPWSCIPEFNRKWEHEAFRNLLLEAIEEMEADPSVVGFGGHIMAVATAS